MAAKSPVALILGAGPKIGQSTARFFASKGYKVAIAARSINKADSTENQLNIPSDFTNPDDVINAFTEVKKVFGIPSVVVYNASQAKFTPPDDPFALPLSDLISNTNVNIYSAFVAAQQAVQGFSQLPDSAARTFLYTGNVLNTTIIPKFMNQGIGKSGAAHMIWQAAAAYKDRGYKFYYVDERKADGAPIYKVDGDAHAQIFWKLAEDKTQGPWLQTFVKGAGYTKFHDHYVSPSM